MQRQLWPANLNMAIIQCYIDHGSTLKQMVPSAPAARAPTPRVPKCCARDGGPEATTGGPRITSASMSSRLLILAEVTRGPGTK
jgi:hypothetical protein